MRQQGQYADSSFDSSATQMQHMSAHRSQQISGMSHFPAADSFRPGEEHQYPSSKADGRWHWDKDGSKGSNQLPSHVHRHGQGSDASRSLYENQRSDLELGMEKLTGKDPSRQVHQEMEVGYEDNSFPQTYEALEQKFFQDIMNLAKEEQDTEDRENARHKEKLNEINTQYQEKIEAIRARQATRREEFLRKELEARYQQYQQANISTYENNIGLGVSPGLDYSGSAANSFSGAHHAYARGRSDTYGRHDFRGSMRGRGCDSHGRYPGGRAYNSRGRYF